MNLKHEQAQKKIKATRLIREIKELKVKYELNEINTVTYFEMVKSKTKELEEVADEYLKGAGVYW